MPLISPIGRTSPRTRALAALIYLLLALGAVSMVYPFLIMIAGSSMSQVDSKEFNAIPAFARDDLALYRKHIEGLFNERLVYLKSVYDYDVSSFGRVVPPEDIDRELVGAWERFLEREQPEHAYAAGYLHTPLSQTMPSALRAYKQAKIEGFDNDVNALNRKLETEFVNWNAFEVRPSFYVIRRNQILRGPFYADFEAFERAQLPPGQRYYFTVEGYYKRQFLMTQYTRDIAAYNEVHGTDYASYGQIRLSPRAPENPAERKNWETFVRHSLHLLWIRVDAEAAPAWRAFLMAKYGDIQVFNRLYDRALASFDAVQLPAALPDSGLPQTDWNAFITGWKDPVGGKIHQPALDHLRIDSLEFRFLDFLAGEGIQVDSGTRPPQREWHYLNFLEQRGALRREFATRNYKKVVDYMLLHGRGFFNTAVYCLLAVVLALIVNPMAAYALSRYRLVNGYKLLLLMLLTMAFPPMVTQIPVFLMLRDFGLLNTFAALVLPGMAHGYSIFLLKGFFDSLPRELFESAQMDGANEWTMFWHISMSLSKPVLAVIALHAFTAAYSNFMFALLICQDEKMWTLMVWLFQLQNTSGQGVVYASLILAAIPTFLVFLFCQNIIMRGIVVPVEK